MEPICFVVMDGREPRCVVFAGSAGEAESIAQGRCVFNDGPVAIEVESFSS